ncbi:MAG: pantetheine-phosphate adenylyltransferase [Clostridia bacterium]|nr:pantetheine-phosphate adenylyltransferase [Clostridia bacterium]
MKKALYPGSFDPITYGHMDVINQALAIFDKVVVAVMVNSSKNKGLFSIEERKALIEQIYKDNHNVEVIAVSGKVAAVDVATQNGCRTMVRGLRDLTDFASEKQLAEINLIIGDERVNTVALFASPKNTTISSTSVKELFSLGKSIDSFVHPAVKQAIGEKLKEE